MKVIAATTWEGTPAALERKKSPKQAKKDLERGCDPSATTLTTCPELADLYLKGAKGVKKDAAKAEQLLRDACDAKGPMGTESCKSLGAVLESRDKGIARGFYAAKCEEKKTKALCDAATRLGG